MLFIADVRDEKAGTLDKLFANFDRTKSWTMVHPDGKFNTFAATYLRQPVPVAIHEMLMIPNWDTPPKAGKTKVQFRTFSNMDRTYKVFLHLDEDGNKLILVTVRPRERHLEIPAAQLMGYSGSNSGFFSMTDAVGIDLVSFENKYIFEV